MSELTKQTITMLEMLPKEDQILANELIKRLVLAWDSDFTKLTSSEREVLENAENDLVNGNFVSHENINWD